MAEYGYGYRSAFDKHTPLFKGKVTDVVPQLAASGAKPCMANAKYANVMSKLPPKKPDVAFQVELEQNAGSTSSIDGNVLGADPSVPDQNRTAVLFAAGSLPKLQSFRAAIHTDGTKLLVVGGRSAGLHQFGGDGFQPKWGNHALFVIDMSSSKWQTAGAALPSVYYEKLAVENAQSCQVKVKDTSGKVKNYLYVVGGYGYNSGYKDMVTFPQLTVIDVDATIEAIWNAAQLKTVPTLDGSIFMLEHQLLQVTGGQLHFNDASNEPTGIAHLYLIVGQAFSGAYGQNSDDFYSYIRGMRKFPLPVPDASTGQLPAVNVVEVKATVDTTNAPDTSSMDAALARRDLNVVPSFLPGTFLPAGNGKPAQCSPGAVILSGVFNQDGSDAPFLQPIVVNFNSTIKPVDNSAKHIPTYASRAFFQLFNQYDCANAQLLSIEDNATQYNVLMGGVSFFYKTTLDPTVTSIPIDQVTTLFSAPFTNDISVVKMDGNNFTQRLVPVQNNFFQESKLSTFGTESFFIPAAGVPLSPVLPSSMGVMDYDAIKTKAIASPDRRFRIGTIYGGIESTVPAKCPPSFDPVETSASSRLIDVYLKF